MQLRQNRLNMRFSCPSVITIHRILGRLKLLGCLLISRMFTKMLQRIFVLPNRLKNGLIPRQNCIHHASIWIQVRILCQIPNGIVILRDDLTGISWIDTSNGIQKRGFPRPIDTN